MLTIVFVNATAGEGSVVGTSSLRPFVFACLLVCPSVSPLLVCLFAVVVVVGRITQKDMCGRLSIFSPKVCLVTDNKLFLIGRIRMWVCFRDFLYTLPYNVKNEAEMSVTNVFHRLSQGS